MALVQKKENISAYLDTAWTISMLRGFALYLIVYFAAPYIALFFKNSESTIIIRVIGITIIFRGLLNIGTIYFQKELEFNKQFIFQFTSTFVEFVVAITFAIILKNVWALVIGQVCGGLTFLVTSYIIHPFRPRFNIESEKAKELFNYGKWIFGSSILVFLITQGDDAFVGRFLGVTMLGFYQMAYRISNMPTTEITSVISNVTFPAFSKIHSNIDRLRESYLKVLAYTTFLSFPIAAVIFVLASDIVAIVLGSKWISIVPAMKILCIEGAMRSLGATTGPIFLGVGKPKIITYFTILRLALLAVLIYPLTNQWGISGASLAVVSGTLLSPIIFYKIMSIIKCSLREFIRTIIVPILSSVLMIISITQLKGYLIPYLSASILFVLVSLCIVLYIFFTLIFERFFNISIMKPVFKTIRYQRP